MEYFWNNSEMGVDYRAFIKIFTKYEIRLNSKNNNLSNVNLVMTEDVLRKKKKIYDDIHNASLVGNFELKDMFQRIDVDGNNEVDD